MLTLVHKSKNPKFLIITPLRLGDEIYPNLMESIWINKIQFDWITYCGPDNIPTNTQNGLNEYCKNNKIPKYFIKVDNDIVFETDVLDEMYKTLKLSSNDIGYCYSSFAFVGKMTAHFPAQEFDINKLMNNNYISSVSMIKTKVFQNTGRYITDNKYVRLLDWAHWLHLYKLGYKGIKCDGMFNAIIDKQGISNASADDYHKKRELVIRDFVNPLKEKFNAKF